MRGGGNVGGIQALRERIRILYSGLLRQFQIVADAHIQSEIPGDSPVILDKGSVLPQVRVRGGAGSSRAGVRFNKRIAGRGDGQSEQAFSKVIETGKGIGAGEIAGEVVQDVVPKNVAAKFEVVVTMHPGERVTILLAMDRGLARAEGVPSH